MTGWQRWIPDAVLGLVVLAFGLVEIDGNIFFGLEPAPIAIVVGLAVAVGLSRAMPGVALALAWLVGAMQISVGTPAMVTELAFTVVAFGCARWGSTAVVWLSGLSIPASVAIAIVGLDIDAFYSVMSRTGLRTLAETASRGNDWRPTVAIMILALIAAPWLLGLALRFSASASRSQESQVTAEAARDQAEEIAHLREEQARLARDVHDVVGHSLAVILAQAESAQYLKDADTQGLKQTMTNIATTARTSLEDVRQVLSSTNGTAAPTARQGSLDSLVDGVRASGHEVVSTDVGAPQPLPPELEVVAFRVLQEMLTNAMKHGHRGAPIMVERHWEGELRIEVRNVIDTDADETQPIVLADPVPERRGQGLEGMRRRLEAVGGRLDVRRRAEPGGPTFTATAWVPVRSR